MFPKVPQSSQTEPLGFPGNGSSKSLQLSQSSSVTPPTSRACSILMWPVRTHAFKNSTFGSLNQLCNATSIAVSTLVCFRTCPVPVSSRWGYAFRANKSEQNPRWSFIVRSLSCLKRWWTWSWGCPSQDHPPGSGFGAKTFSSWHHFSLIRCIPGQTIYWNREQHNNYTTVTCNVSRTMQINANVYQDQTVQ